MEKDKKRHYIYLAGNISEDPRTYLWREEFTKLITGESNVVVLDPCLNEFSQSMKNAISDGLGFTKEVKTGSQKIFRAKDYQLVKICSVLVVNLELFSREKPMIGTVQELSWARDIFYVPVIAITGKVENIYTTHPWIDECCSARVETVEESANMIKTFFLDY